MRVARTFVAPLGPFVSAGYVICSYVPMGAPGVAVSLDKLHRIRLNCHDMFWMGYFIRCF